MATDPVPLYKYLNHIVFILEGSGMVIGNLLIILTILLNKNLRRKELYLIVGLAVSDGLYGIGYFTAGIVRLKFVLTGTDGLLISSWECMRYFQTFFFIIGSQTVALMMTALSVDRLIAVVWFNSYLGLTKRYTLTVLAGVLAHAIFSACAAFLSSYRQADYDVQKYLAICISPWAVPKWYAIYNNTLNAFGGFVSVGLYIIVVVAYRKRTALHVANLSHSGQQNQMNRQNRLTKTLGIVTICTFFFHSLPYTVILLMTVFKVKNALFAVLGPYTWIMVAVNSLINILIYVWRITEIRAAMWNLVRCRKGTANQVSVATIGKVGAKDALRMGQSCKTAGPFNSKVGAIENL